MRKVVLIPTYWAREAKVGWVEGDAVYDHPTPIDEEGTLQRTLESMKILDNKDFKLVILICPTTPEIEEQAEKQTLKIIEKAGLNAETYVFTLSDLRRIVSFFQSNKVKAKIAKLLNMSGYANVRNMCLLCAEILAADTAILIDDDEVFELPDFVERITEFIGTRVYGGIVHGVAGYYLNKENRYYDDVEKEVWMTYWDRFGAKARAFDEIIGNEPRIKRTPFAFGGAMAIDRELFTCVPFDPEITRGEDIDYVINSRMYGFSFFLDKTLSIKHLPERKKHPQWKRMREDIYRFVYEKAKLNAQYKTSNMVMVSAEDFDPYPGEFLQDDLQEKIFRSNMMLAAKYMLEGDAEGSKEALNNISIAENDAQPKFDPFEHYCENQKNWEQLMVFIAENRYELRKIMEENNLSKAPVERDEKSKRKLSEREFLKNLKEAFPVEMNNETWELVMPLFFVKTFFEDEMVFQSGDFNDGLYVVLKGEVSILSASKGLPSGKLSEIARLYKGDILGESCLKYKTFANSGRAEQFTELIGIKAEDMQRLVEISPEFGVAFYQLVLAKTVNKIRSRNTEKLNKIDDITQ